MDHAPAQCPRSRHGDAMGADRLLAMSLLALLLLACAHADVDVARRWRPGPGRGHSKPARSPGNPDFPMSADFESGVKFELYTRENPDEPEHIDIYDKCSPTYFRHGRPTKIGIHGWLSDMKEMRNLWSAFLRTEDINFILVNWTSVDSILYPSSRSKVPHVARRLSYLLDSLANAEAVDLNDVHVIGHSLGAHIAGIAGKLVQGGDRLVGRITGFDPAGPLFEDDPAQRLDPSDATFVDVIHTCGNILGYKGPLGHVDFYPNGGKCSQPGCMMADITTGSCSHDRGYDYFLESLLSASSFVAWPCQGYGDIAQASDSAATIVMGNACPNTARGAYCLNTRSSYPYGLGLEGSERVRNALRSAPLPHLPPPVAAAIRRKYFSRQIKHVPSRFKSVE